MISGKCSQNGIDYINYIKYLILAKMIGKKIWNETVDLNEEKLRGDVSEEMIKINCLFYLFIYNLSKLFTT